MVGSGERKEWSGGEWWGRRGARGVVRGRSGGEWCGVVGSGERKEWWEVVGRRGARGVVRGRSGVEWWGGRVLGGW